MKFLKFFAYILWVILLQYPFVVHAKNLSWQNDKININVYQQNNTAEQKTQILVHFTLLDGWHISWENPGDAGVPTQFSWQLPADVQIEKQNQSVPEKFLYDDILTQFGYSNEAYYLFEAQPLNTEKPLILHIEWTACREYCQPETTDFVLYPAQENVSETQWQKLLQQGQKTFPLKLSKPAQARYQKDFLELKIPLSQETDRQKTLESAYFIPFEEKIISPDTEQQIKLNEHNLQIMTESERPGIYPKKGLLMNQNQGLLFDIEPKTQPYPYLTILLFAFLGGLILNLMPCILPILSLKIISLKNGLQSPNRKKHALMYLCGVLLCFALIAALLYIFKTTGEQIGWGFQLQSPTFITFLLVFFIIILLFMWELIRLPFNPSGKLAEYASAGSFLTGFFAVLVASPCTGPFMGAALGYALLEPPHTYFPIFLMLGFGYALPFTLIEMYPDFVQKYIPRPGKWMSKLKFILSVPILLTCFWLAWILYHQLSKTSSTEQIWQPYHTQKIEELLSEGKPVFVEFTAKWCLTCLLNEKTTLQTKSFTDYASQKGITLFKADWTNQSDEIAQSLKKYGRNSVPLYVYYPQDDDQYQILPQILTPAIVFEALE